MKKVLKLERYMWESSALIASPSCVGHDTFWNQEKEDSFLDWFEALGQDEGKEQKNKVIFRLSVYQQEV